MRWKWSINRDKRIFGVRSVLDIARFIGLHSRQSERGLLLLSVKRRQSAKEWAKTIISRVLTNRAKVGNNVREAVAVAA